MLCTVRWIGRDCACASRSAIGIMHPCINAWPFATSTGIQNQEHDRTCEWSRNSAASRSYNNKQGLINIRPRLTRLHSTHEALFWGFSSMNSSMGGAIAVLINRLAKQLHISFFLKYAFRERYVEWGEAERNHYFWLILTPKLCESTFLGASLVEPFYFIPFNRKRLQAAPKAAREAPPNRT